MNHKSRYLSSAFLLLTSTVVIKVIGALYKIPLTSSVGAVGRGYFSIAYHFYLPLHTILMGAFPIALSRLISQYNAREDRTMLRSLKRAAGRLFFLTGAVGTLLLLLCAFPYVLFIAGVPKSLPTILVLAPSLLFSCVASCYRGYYEGFVNMKPTAVSQLLEALFKCIFGLLFARITMRFLFIAYRESGRVLSFPVGNEEEALSLIYPVTSAAAMLGVTLGTLVSLLYLMLCDRKDRRERVPKNELLRGRRALLSFSFPLLLSCAVQSVFQFLDTASVQFSLNRVPTETVRRFLSQPLSIIAVSSDDLPAYAYGLFCTALDFKNLIPGITMALGVCAVPALCREYEARHQEGLESLMNAVFRYTAVLSVLGSGMLALFSSDILRLFYAGDAPDIVAGATDLVRYFALTVPLYSLASTAVFCVQALGRPEKSIASYAVSGIVRVVLNLLLIRMDGFYFYGAVISGAVGYLVLFVWNYLLAKKYSGVKLRHFNILVKPVTAGVFGISAVLFLQKYVILTKNLFFNLLIESLVFASIYCILCILWKVFRFKEIFCVFKIKKMA